MIDPVVIDFVARGISDVGRAFDTIEKRAERFEGRATRAVRQGARERVRATEDEEQKRERAYAKLTREIEREQDREKRGHERAEKEKTRATERAEAERTRMRSRASQAAVRLATQQAEEELRARKRVDAQIRQVGGRSMGKLVAGGAMLAGAVGIGGGFMLADAMRERAAAGQNAALLVNAVTGPGGVPAGANISAILGRASQVSRETGMGMADVTAGALSYARGARGGDYEGVMKNMGFFAKMANVTGTDINDIASAAGTLQSQNADLGGANNARMQEMLMAAYAQSKQGSVSMSEAAKQFGTLGSTRGLYQGNEAANQTKLLGLGQIAASGGERGDIGTYIKNLSLEAAAHRHRTKKTMGLEDDFGVKFDKYGRMESPEEMVAKVFKGTGGDLGKIHAIFGNRGMPLFTELQKSFIDAGAGDKGMAAVKAQIAGVTGATGTPQDLEKQHEQLLSDPAKKFELAVTRIKDTLMTSMEPALTRVAEKMEKAAPAIEAIVEKGGELAAWLAENPLRGVISIMGASVAKDIAAAAIGESIKKESIKALGGMSIATLAVTAGAVMIMQAVDKDVERQAKEGSESAGAEAHAISTAGAVGRGAVSITAAKEEQARLKAIVERNKNAVGNTGVLESIFTTLGDPFGKNMVASPTGGEINKDKLAQQQRTYTDSADALAKLTTAIENAEKRINKVATNTGPGDPARHVSIPQRSVN